MVSNVIAKALNTMGINDGDCVLAHTSVRSFGIRNMSPKFIVDALVVAAGKSGTVIIPALSYATVTAADPVFDCRSTPSCVGALPEFFRTNYPGCVRSVHPTHSCCACGAKKDEFTAGHYLDRTPCGSHSPFRILAENNGKIVFFGCGTRPNTSMHAIEELYAPDYLYGDDIEYTITDNSGRTYRQVYAAHGFKNTVQRYDRLEALMPEGSIHRTTIFGSETVVMDAATVWRVAGEYYKKDPHYFVDIG